MSTLLKLKDKDICDVFVSGEELTLDNASECIDVEHEIILSISQENMK
jgi:hypothetical protein